MKSKVIFTIILFSLLLNIFHDLFINNQIKTNVSKTVLIDKSQPLKTHYSVCDLHEVFHFLGILPHFHSVHSSSMVSTKLSFKESISPQKILESSFKPPKT